MPKTNLVRYIPLTGSPVTLPLEEAERQLRREDEQYVRMLQAGLRVSAPRIERPAPRAGRKRGAALT